MERLSFTEFAALPAGAIFYHYAEGEFFSAELFRKEETLFVDGEATDFFETKLCPSVEEVRDESTFHFGTSRWALYEFDTAEFVVLDADDIKDLIQNLTPQE
jgi:hypothetical protein